jgi:beta-glucosidase
MFDDKFVWGVASSSYQVEGTDPEDGRGKTVWDAFTEQGASMKSNFDVPGHDPYNEGKWHYAIYYDVSLGISTGIAGSGWLAE